MNKIIIIIIISIIININIIIIAVTGDMNVPDLCATIRCATGYKCDIQFSLEDGHCCLTGVCIPDSQDTTVLENPCYYTKCSAGFECDISVCNRTATALSECDLCYRCAPMAETGGN